ncbi:MAG: M48 family metalloprotease [Gammaproteobacteria bacterium]|nr:M48 family metalloprotease [Gammaproteobacteria bacterium]MCW8958666.1 M48 family metalloprotease [Gammaproteobacteria bacterium]MCW8973784.1 M48 family metalloprotease [Gammaproteobacteria bacterium]MCW8991603.1 M48 family metalloprotease [Gammaproteobacteria bacterium]
MKKSHATLLIWLFTALAAAVNAPLHAQQETGMLPEMGDSSSTLLSQEDELRIGREMLHSLEKNGAIIQDPIVAEYIESVGHSLSSAAITDRNHFHFFTVNASSINAFAMPGGFIGVHAGLILASESESELAAVVAHEIAHVTQHHIARGVEQANQMNLPMTAAVIAALLLGGGDPQVANAALAATMGGAQQMQIDFTRANEKEADRVGMQLLASSDFDPRGMSGFFAKLQSESRYYGDGVPEFLRTHPVTTSRIAEAEDRARQYPLRLSDNSIQYLLVKARLRLMLAKSLDTLSSELEAEAPTDANEREAHRYLQALVQKKNGNVAAARERLTALLEQNPGRIAYIHELGQLESSEGEHQRASELYLEGLEQYPGNALLTRAYCKTLITDGKHDKARKSLETLLRNRPNDSEAYRLLARLEAESGNLAASYLAQAEYYFLKGEPHSAIDQLNQAKRLSPLPDYFAARIEARLKQLKEELARHQKGKRNNEG